MYLLQQVCYKLYSTYTAGLLQHPELEDQLVEISLLAFLDPELRRKASQKMLDQKNFLLIFFIQMEQPHVKKP